MQTVEISEPKLSRFLFADTRMSWLWLVVRVYLGWEWVLAGWHKVLGQGWGPDSLLAYWTKSVAIPTAPAKPAIAYDWYRSFLEILLSIDANVWMAPLVAWGELLVGVALIAGAFVGIAAVFGAFMNLNFMLAGSASTNPVMFLIAIVIILAWRTAGWVGLDRYILPALGTPWQPGGLFNKQS
ncbi:MAG: DoxX family protein [bacterium]|nr:DoxX family protein [bacterium]